VADAIDDPNLTLDVTFVAHHRSPREAAGDQMPRQLAPADLGTISVVPANQASRDDLHAIFGVRGYPAYCQCQRFKIGPHGWTEPTVAERMQRLEQETHVGYPSAPRTSGLVLYLDGEPVGWCAVEPRSAYPRLPPARVAFKARGEDAEDETVWAVTCFTTRAGYRRRGVTRVLAQAAVEHARSRGARALEAYPMMPEPGQEITWGETHVGTRNIFEDAGFREVAHPTPRRVVMRIDF
jgi:GNAT superfamily N-acetyltransferase